MSGNENAKPMKSLPVLCRWALAIVPLALAVSCGEAAPSFVIPPGGSGGTAGSSGTGGMAGNAGTGGVAGIGGMAGTGGMAGSGGAAGTGGNAGSGGAGGSSGVCATSALCRSCPSEALPDTLLCDTDDDCAFPGYLCVPSGCETHAGAPIGQCQPAAGGSCVGDDDNDDCPNAGDYDCTTVGAGGKRCVRVSTGCNPDTEGYDCAPGFSCEGGECVDRRVPCDDSTDCPTSHICHTGIPTGSFCVRVYRTCHVEDDCRWAGVLLGAGCVDVDNHGRDECTGDLDTPLNPCVNAMCSGSTPVCENGVFGTGSKAVCGDYGLCRTDDDCGGAFVCADLFQNGRKECVPSPGVPSPDDCESATDCPPQQVCAAPRDGGSPSCQAGKEAM